MPLVINMKEKKKIYIIEHLEPQLWPWCVIEYENISKTVGKNNLWFTNIKKKDKNKLKKHGKVFHESVSELRLRNICILDPAATETLAPHETEYEYFIFGGILGDYPPKQRTKEELTPKIHGKVRNIGKEQMSTDNAVYVVHQIANKKKKIEKIPFQDNVSIEINSMESVELPYRYALVKGKPFMSKKIVEHLKKKKSF